MGDDKLRAAAQDVIDAWDRYVEAHVHRGHPGEACEPDRKLGGDCGKCAGAMYGTEIEMDEYVMPALRAALASAPDEGRSDD